MLSQVVLVFELGEFADPGHHGLLEIGHGDALDRVILYREAESIFQVFSSLILFIQDS